MTEHNYQLDSGYTVDKTGLIFVYHEGELVRTFADLKALSAYIKRSHERDLQYTCTQCGLKMQPSCRGCAL